MSKGGFRRFLPPPDYPRIQGIEDRDAYAHGDIAIVASTFADRLSLLDEPFRGVTTDGIVREELYSPAPNGAPTAAMVEAARHLLSIVDPEQESMIRRPVDSEQWRRWSNPEHYLFRGTLRLEEQDEEVREAVLAVLRASMSTKGYEKSINCMRINHFLGELVRAPRVMNEYSYNFCLFGEPSATEPWGWQYFGHHLCLHCFVLGEAMTITPTFMGAEPNEIDVGRYAGTTNFLDEERLGLDLMQSLDEGQQRRAQVFKLMKDPAMPEGRWIPSDQRHLGGACHDNRVVPYEGLAVSDMSAQQQASLLDLLGVFLEYLPPGPLAARLAEIERLLPATHFCWIGGYEDGDVFYYRVQSPVIMAEFDHHSGVFLCNSQPERFHIHTLVRSPNGNDYGKAWLRQHRGGA